jgi:hypothetical protein
LIDWHFASFAVGQLYVPLKHCVASSAGVRQRQQDPNEDAGEP